MRLQATSVGLLPCRAYERQSIKKAVDRILSELSFRPQGGLRVLLKPNLVTSYGHGGLACTHPEFCAAVAEWFLDHGARVVVGDSPAFGRPRQVMEAFGYGRAFQGLSVEFKDFTATRKITLPAGMRVRLSTEALDCDILVNLPRIKTHGQVLLSLAVKNYFGTVAGFQKPWLHTRYGDVHDRFESLLVSLLEVLPDGVTLIDGIVAMHLDGPIKGKPYPLGLIGGSVNPVALDTALYQLFSVEPGQSPLWSACLRRGLTGARPEEITHLLTKPPAFAAMGFILPSHLRPLSFHPGRLFKGWLKRILLHWWKI